MLRIIRTRRTRTRDTLLSTTFTLNLFRRRYRCVVLSYLTASSSRSSLKANIYDAGSEKRNMRNLHGQRSASCTRTRTLTRTADVLNPPSLAPRWKLSRAYLQALYPTTFCPQGWMPLGHVGSLATLDASELSTGRLPHSPRS